MKNAGKACNNRLYRHIRTFEKIVKNYFVIFIKIVLVFLALPAVFFDLAGLFGLGILGVMAFQGYPVIGCVIIAFGVVLSMTAYILFLFTYVLGGRGAKA